MSWFQEESAMISFIFISFCVTADESSVEEQEKASRRAAWRSGGQMVGVTLKISGRQMDKQTDSKHIHKKY